MIYKINANDWTKINDTKYICIRANNIEDKNGNTGHTDIFFAFKDNSGNNLNVATKVEPTQITYEYDEAIDVSVTPYLKESAILPDYNYANGNYPPSTYLNEDKGYIEQNFLDESGKPVVKHIKEWHNVSPTNCAVQTNYDIDKFYGVEFLAQDGTYLTEVNSMEDLFVEGASHSYYIGENNMIYGTPDLVGKYVSVDYYGSGKTIINCNRIYYRDKINGTPIILEELMGKGEECLKALASLGSASEIINMLENKIKEGKEIYTKVDNWSKSHANVDTLITDVNNMKNLKIAERLNDCDSKISQLNNTKITKNTGSVTMSDMAQDVKEAMTGGSVAVVGEGCVSNINLSNEVCEELGYFNEITDYDYFNGYYDEWHISGQDDPDYHTYIVAADKNNKYKCTTNIKDSVLGIVHFLDSNKKLLKNYTIGLGNIGKHTDYMFTIPNKDEIKYIAVTSYYDKPCVKKYCLSEVKYPLCVKKSDDNVYVKCRYTTNKELIIHFAKVGCSKLMQIAGIYTKDNSSSKLDGDFTLQTELRKAYTDFVSPYVILANNNANGDMPNSSDYTGGWHGYGGDQTGAKTANMIGYTVKADNRVISSNTIIHANEVKIIVKNNINASNTKKADGTGRDVLGEVVEYVITPCKIEVRNIITALEDIKIKHYNGLQTDNGGKWSNIVKFVETPIKAVDFTSDSTSTAKECRRIICSDTSNELEMFVTNEGIGTFEWNDKSYSAFSKNYKKVYFDLIDSNSGKELKEGQQLYFNGGYIFRSIT